MQGPLPEVIGYVGGALVASAGLNFIAQSWEKWSYLTRVSVVGTALVILYAAAGAVIGIAGGRAALESPEKANRRRLTAVLMALAAVLVGALTAVIIDHQGWMDFEDSMWWIVLPGALALLAAGVGAWFAPGAVSTLAVAATSAWTGVALTLFARGASWAWAVGGVIAAAMAAMAFAGQALGWVAALLVAGVVLLACSGLLLALRRRSGRAPTT